MIKKQLVLLLAVPFLLTSCNIDNNGRNNNQNNQQQNPGDNGGSGDNSESGSSQDFSDLFDKIVQLGDHYKIEGTNTVNRNDHGVEIQQVSQMNQIVNGNLMQLETGSSQIMSGSFSDFKAYLSNMLQQELTDKDVFNELEYQKSNGVEVETPREDYYVLTTANALDVRYVDSSDSSGLPLVYKFLKSENKYLAVHEYMPDSLFTNFSELSKNKNWFKWDASKSAFVYDASKATETEIKPFGPSTKFVELIVENEKLKQVNTISESSGFPLNITAVFSYENISVVLPSGDNLGTCEHSYYPHYQNSTINDEVYHFHKCSKCGDMKDYGKCSPTNDICDICSTIVMDIIYLYGSLEAYEDGNITLSVGTQTNKIYSVNIYYPGQNEDNKKIVYNFFNISVPSIINMENSFINGVHCTTINGTNYILISVMNNDDSSFTYYIMTGCTVELIGTREEGETKITGGTLINKIIRGEVYQK